MNLREALLGPLRAARRAHVRGVLAGWIPYSARGRQVRGTGAGGPRSGTCRAVPGTPRAGRKREPVNNVIMAPIYYAFPPVLSLLLLSCSGNHETTYTRDHVSPGGVPPSLPFPSLPAPAAYVERPGMEQASYSDNPSRPRKPLPRKCRGFVESEVGSWSCGIVDTRTCLFTSTFRAWRLHAAVPDALPGGSARYAERRKPLWTGGWGRRVGCF